MANKDHEKEKRKFLRGRGLYNDPSGMEIPRGKNHPWEGYECFLESHNSGLGIYIVITIKCCEFGFKFSSIIIVYLNSYIKHFSRR